MAFKMKGSPYPNKPTPIKQKEKGKDVEGSPPDLNYSMEKVQQGPISERSTFFNNKSYTDKVYNKAIDDMIKDIDR